jgi:hypothetical protein
LGTVNHDVSMATSRPAPRTVDEAARMAAPVEDHRRGSPHHRGHTGGVAAGSLVAALFVVVALFEFLPQMESFAAFGIKAQWRKKLDEAEEILEKLKQSTKASAQLGYYLLGWGSRMGGQTTGMKRDVAEQIDKALTNLGVDPDTLAIFKRDYLFFARFDLFQTFGAIASWNIRANNLSPKPPRINLLEAEFEPGGIVFRSFCHDRIPKADLPPEDAAILGTFADQVADIDEECRRTGRVTDEAIKLIDARRTEDRLMLYRQLFGRDPPS